MESGLQVAGIATAERDSATPAGCQLLPGSSPRFMWRCPESPAAAPERRSLGQHLRRLDRSYYTLGSRAIHQCRESGYERQLRLRVDACPLMLPRAEVILQSPFGGVHDDYGTKATQRITDAS